MKAKYTVIKVAAAAAVVAGFIAGCSTPTIPVTMNVAGEIKLTGVSKIALADFNTLDEDVFSGAVAADAETCALVKSAVASSFYASPMYQIADFNVEKLIHEQNTTKQVKNRFDAFICGRVWWQIAPETTGVRPKKFTLKKWDNVPYKVKNPLTKKEEQLFAKVTTETRDVVQMLEYSAQNATLMLTLSIYRVSYDGSVQKIIDTYQVTDEGFTLVNGQMTANELSVGIDEKSAADRLKEAGKDKGMFAGMGDQLNASVKDVLKPEVKANGKRDANGKIILTQKTVAMPSELQAKLMLASSISKKLSAKLAPSKITFDVPADLGDARLEQLLVNGAFGSLHEYALYMLRNKLGLQICEKIADYIPEMTDECAYPVPDSTEKFTEYDDELVKSMVKNGMSLYFFTLGTSHDAAEQLAAKAKGHDEMIKYLAGEKLDVYFYALGITYEAKQQYEEATEAYRFAFNLKPNKPAAIALARASLALGESARLTQTRKAKKAAKSKTRMD